AVAYIEAGKVEVDGLPRTNPRSIVDESASIRIADESRPFRGYEKLAAAFDRFGVDPTGAVALDAGAAAGGFTRLLLDRGAERVYAVEVGYGQLLGSLRQDPRVVNLERTNVGDLTRELVPDALDLVTLDLGYLALALGVPQLNVLRFSPGAALVALVKPMSELGIGVLPTRQAEIDEAVARATAAMRVAGWAVLDTAESPIRGSRGAVEVFVHATR
nr:hypothetical protein [Actinomycetota bacterium]